MRRLAPLLLFAACAVPPGAPPEADSDGAVERYSATAFATRFELRLAGAERATLDAAAAACFEELARCEATASVWRPDSAASRLNATGRVDGPPELLELLAACVAACERTGGAFDATVGGLLEAYGYYAGEDRAPSPGTIGEALARTGCGVLEVDARGALVAVPGARIDLGGAAKGWAVDRLVAVLRAHGVEDALVSGGGSAVRAVGADPGADGWTVSVPGPDGDREVVLRDSALAVSGQLSEPFFVDGKLASHVLDPRTGAPVEHATVLAAVTAPTALEADLLSTALLVLGADAAAEWLERDGAPGVTARLVSVDPADPARRAEATLGVALP